jgi:hypothetical protein
MEGRQVSGAAAVLGEAIGGLLGALWAVEAVGRFKDPVTPEIVCECTCGRARNAQGSRIGWPQRFADRENCGTPDSILCDAGGQPGRLEGCVKTAVPVARFAPQEVREDLVVKDEG